MFGIGSILLCKAVEQECQHALGYRTSDTVVFVDHSADDLFSFDKVKPEDTDEPETVEENISIEGILDALAADPMALSMLTKYASANGKEKERMTSYLKAVVLDK